jgi:hypothetical protein
MDVDLLGSPLPLVLDMVNLLNYQSSQLARGLRGDMTKMIGIVIPDVTNSFFLPSSGAPKLWLSPMAIESCTDNDHSKEMGTAS